jgi:hypothetical protein
MQRGKNKGKRVFVRGKYLHVEEKGKINFQTNIYCRSQIPHLHV